MSPRFHRNAFTLIELLVVVAIIALLISILLPSLSRARESARVVQCLSNQRQMGQAAYMYADENENWYPPQYDSTRPDPNNNGGSSLWYANDDYAAIAGMDPNGNIYFRWNPLLCPDTVPPVNAGLNATTSGRKTMVQGYAFNYDFFSGASEAINVQDAGGTVHAVRRTGVVSPASKVWMTDGTRATTRFGANTTYWYNDSWDHFYMTAYPHLTGQRSGRFSSQFSTNVLWYDGHASTESWRQLFKRGDIDSDRWEFIWSAYNDS